MRNANMVASDERRKLGIFVSSPGDVSAERVIADRVIRRLQREFRNFVDIKPILWENLPLISVATFQDGIDALLKSEPIDVAIFILGARLGSSPGRNYIRADGKPYGSGTEYEFDTMMEAYRRSGRPLILFYKKEISEKQLITTSSVEDFDAIEAVIRQFKAVNQFVEEHFFDKDKGAYKAFHLLDDKSVGFEQRLEAHLREIIGKLLLGKETLRWSGNPYKGLLSFGIEDEAIFFGRSAVLNEIERDLFARCSSDAPRLSSVIVSGESGAGKSSFVKAGLLPDLLRTTVFPQSRVEYRIVTPGQMKGRLCSGLWRTLKEILPELPDLAQPSVADVPFAEMVATALKNAIQKRADETGLRPVPLLIVDQLEETFTHAEITEGERAEFAKLLSALQKSNFVLLVFTIRSDFYQNLTSCGEWLAVKKESLLCDLPRMTVDEYKQVISAPAELAGYKWQQDKRGGRWLNEVILDDAIRQQVPLPLLEFALADIVERSGDERVLSFSAYKDMSGLSGAIQKRADEVFGALSSDEKAALFRILGSLITISPDGKYVRTEMPVKIVKSDRVMRKVLDVFVANRLFSVSGDEARGATVTIAHEALISQWKVIQDWIRREEQLIRAKRECEVGSEKWYARKKDDLLLLTTPASLAQAEDLMICWPHGLSSRVCEFVANSFKKKARKFILFRVLGAIVCLVCLVGAVAISCSPDLLQRVFDPEYYFGLEVEIRKAALWSLLFQSIIMLVLVYSLVQRFRGQPIAIRARMDLRVYVLALILLMTATATYVGIQLTSSHDWKVGSDKTAICAVICVFLLLILLVFRSLSWTRHMVLRQKRLCPFKFRQPIVALLTDKMAFGMGFVMTLCIVPVLCGLMMAQFVARQDYDACNEIVKRFTGQRDENGFITPSEARTLIEAKLTIGQAEDVLNDTSLLQSIGDDAERANLMCRCYSAVGDVESAYHWAKEDATCDGYVKLFLALELGKTVDASEIFAGLARPPSSPVTLQLLKYAHGMLLCSNSLPGAVALYRDINRDVHLRHHLLSDFVHLKRQSEYRSRIAEVEGQLSLLSVPALDGEASNIAEDLPWLVGTWRWEDDGMFDVEIDPRCKINCRNVAYGWSGQKLKKLGFKYSIIRAQKQQGTDKCKVEEVDPLTGIVCVGLWNLEDKNTIEVEVLFNGYGREKGLKIRYRRLSSNGVTVVREVRPYSQAESQGVQVGDIVCEYCGTNCLADCKALNGLMPKMENEGKKIVVARKNGDGAFEIKSFVFTTDPMGICIAPKTAYMEDWESVCELWQEYNAKDDANKGMRGRDASAP